MATVTIIIPTYNHAEYLPYAINSVLSQEDRVVEILVIDDGSTDHTREVAAGFGDAIRYVYQPNRGLSAARNTGLSLASGSFVCVLDADDLLEPDYMTVMVKSLEANPAAAAVYCGFQTIDPGNERLFQAGLRLVPPEAMYETLLLGNFIVPPCMLVRREAYEAVGFFDESLTSCEDWDVWLRLARDHKVLPVNAILVRYRVRPGSMSGNTARMLANRLAVLGKFVGPEEAGGPIGARRAYSRAYYATALEYIQQGDETNTLVHFTKAAELDLQILEEVPVFYELALWDQPKGLRGDPDRFDLSANMSRVVKLVEQVFERIALSETARRRAYGTAFLAAGLVAYNSGQFGLSRRYIRRAAGYRPDLLSEPKVITTFGKSLLGPRRVARLRRFREVLIRVG